MEGWREPLFCGMFLFQFILYEKDGTDDKDDTNGTDDKDDTALNSSRHITFNIGGKPISKVTITTHVFRKDNKKDSVLAFYILKYIGAA